MSRFGTITINQVVYDLDDLDLDEMEAIEELGGGEFTELNFGSAKVMKAIAFTLMKRTNPALEMAEVGKIKLISFGEADEEMPDTGPLDVDAAASPNGSEPAAAGVPDSAESIRG
jgi:hypothetical protein